METCATITLMTPTDLRQLPADRLPELPPLLQALWHDAHGNWARAHEIAQDIETPEAARLHAYLHRREGDDFNAAYWYRRARQPIPTSTLEDEWTALATAFQP
jgi:hypothetical protein